MLGEGAMGVVFAALDRRLGRPVAVKVLKSVYARDRTAVARFEREAWTCARLRSLHIVGVVDFDYLETGEPFLVMEQLDGETLAERMRRGLLPPREIVDVSTQVLDALAAAHKAGVVHRDLKPQNIHLARTGARTQAKLTDFGIAKLMLLEEGEARTAPGIVLGTPAYMSPEQARGEPLDARCDLFAVSIVMYEAMTGALPYAGTSAHEVMRGLALGESVPLVRRLPDIDPELAAIVERGLARDREARWTTAGEMRDALLAWALVRDTSEVPVSGQAPSTPSSSFEITYDSRRQLKLKLPGVA